MPNHLYAFFLGNHPTLSATEIWYALAARGFQPCYIDAGGSVFILSTIKKIPDDFLISMGGTERIAEIITSLQKEPTPNDILTALTPLPKKWMLGISAMDYLPDIKKLAREIKQQARNHSSHMRFVLPKHGHRLNTAQVHFNKLTQYPNSELTVIRRGEMWHVARTIQVQNIALYAKRDRGKPDRNPRSGMMPPKLAQIMISIVTSLLNRRASLKIFDPFCGTGTILQEGYLLGHTMTGSDANMDAVNASRRNLLWLAANFQLTVQNVMPFVVQQDAGKPWPNAWKGFFDAIVTEPFLGKPITAPLSQIKASQYINDLLPLYRAFLKNAHTAFAPHGVLFCIFPSVATRESGETFFTPLLPAILDEITKFGYRSVQLVPDEISTWYKPTQRGTLIYKRRNALVARELTLLVT